MKRAGLIGLVFLFSGLGCVKGPKGEPGVAGSPGSGRVISTINCSAPIVGVDPDLNGLEIEYSAVLTSAGDVYATGAIIDEVGQTSGTAFYAAGQSGAENASVIVTADYMGSANSGWWEISLDRSTLVTSVTYTDGGTIDMNFNSSACTVQNW